MVSGSVAMSAIVKSVFNASVKVLLIWLRYTYILFGEMNVTLRHYSRLWRLSQGFGHSGGGEGLFADLDFFDPFLKILTAIDKIREIH